MNAPEIRKAIEALTSAFAADPTKARAKNAPATAKLGDGLQCEVTGPYGARIVTDMPPAMGGAASGPNPGWFLRAALASCTTTAIAMRAAKLGIGDVSAALAAVRTKVRIRGDAPPGVLRELAQWGDAHSPVGCTLRRMADCSLEVEVP